MKPSDLHPIAAEAGLLITEEMGDLLFKEEALSQIRSALFRLRGEHELRHALESLVDLAAHLELDRQLPVSAEQLLLVAASRLKLVEGL